MLKMKICGILSVVGVFFILTDIKFVNGSTPTPKPIQGKVFGV